MKVQLTAMRGKPDCVRGVSLPGCDDDPLSECWRPAPRSTESAGAMLAIWPGTRSARIGRRRLGVSAGGLWSR
jgi:hypothetical protein